MIKAYKGFDLDMTCRGMKFEEGQTYTEERAKVCDTGFHACEYPLEIFDYYPPGTSRYHEVELDGQIDMSDNDTKLAATQIRIGAEISIAGLVKAAIEYTKTRTTPEGEAKTGYQGAASATGDQGAASATGDKGAASATGYQGAASATGYQGAASATGVGCVAVASGFRGRAMGSIGNAICVCERGAWDRKTFPLLGIKAAIVDGEIIKADTWYRLDNGEFVECGDDEED